MHAISNIEAALHLSHAIKRQIQQQLEAEQSNLTPMHMRVMRIIDKHPPCTANDVVQKVKRDKAQITRLIKGLMDEGMVVKAPNPNDKRSQILVLTDKAKTLQQTVLGSSGSLQTLLRSGVSEADLDTFVKVAQQMTKNLE